MKGSVKSVRKLLAPLERAEGIPNRKGRKPSVQVARFFDQDVVSVMKFTGISKSAMQVVRAARPSIRKKLKLRTRPKGRVIRSLGIRKKVRPIPWLGSSPKLASAGNIMSPARNAINVSNKVMIKAEATMFSFLEAKLP